MNERASQAAIPLCRPRISLAQRNRLLTALDSGWLGYGPQCRRLEASFTHGRGGWALATSSCTSALYLAARLVRKLSADAAAEVIVPALTFVSSAIAFAQAGVRPVIAEVRRDDLLLDPDRVERALTPNTRAIVVVHLYGQHHPELPRLRALADARGLLLIEDCAHRVDLLDAVEPAGDLLCYSFNAVKELPSGEGGLLWGRDPAHEPWIRAVSNLGLTVDTVQRAATLSHADYAFAAEPGLKLRSNDLTAALAHAGIASLAADRACRREQGRLYDRLLAPLAPTVHVLDRCDDDSFLMYVVKVPPAARAAIRAALAGAGVATSVHYPSLARHPLLGDDRAGAACTGQDASIMSLPHFLDLGEEDRRRVVTALALALDAAHARLDPRAAAD